MTLLTEAEVRVFALAETPWVRDLAETCLTETARADKAEKALADCDCTDRQWTHFPDGKAKWVDCKCCAVCKARLAVAKRKEGLK